MHDVALFKVIQPKLEKKLEIWTPDLNVEAANDPAIIKDNLMSIRGYPIYDDKRK